MISLLRRQYYPHVLLGLYSILWVVCAINPTYRSAWWLENVPIMITVPLIVWMHYYFRLSNLSYTLIFTFLVLHTIGGHYTYAEVPFGYWLQNLFGFSRNHYDRIVHFSFGFLFAYPVREIFLRVATTRGVWGFWFPLELTAALSALYEIIEWLNVIWTNPQAGIAYLGAQGDEWDAQKDMALATLGALLAMLIALAVNWRYNTEFRDELRESVRVKRKRPLGEIGLAEMMRKGMLRRK